MRVSIATVLAGGLLAAPCFAQAPATWNGLPDRFQIDAGYYRLGADSVLTFNGPAGGTGEVDFEDELGLDDQIDTFWVDGRWRVGRRHQLQVGYTRSSRDRESFTLATDFVWGGETYTAGLSVTPETSARILGGYYRFAALRRERLEIGPTLGVGYLWVDARIRATGSVAGPAGGTETRSLDESANVGSITGAIGAYAEGWPARRLALRGDFLYISVNLGDSEASVTDWRIAANYYFSRNLGAGVQYKYNQYTYDRGILVSKLGGEISFDGFQVFLTSRF